MSVVELLDDYRVARVILRRLDGRKLTLDGVARATEPPLFEVTFQPDALTLAELDEDAKVQLLVETGGANHSVEARIEKVVSDTRLQMIELESFTHVQKRSYFRVDTRTKVDYCPLSDDFEKLDDQATTIHSVVNLSAGGICLPVSTPLPSNQRVQLDILLADPPQKIRCYGRVVRTQEPDEEGEPFHLALEFDQIEPDARDAIMAHCFSEQRKQLRIKVSLAGR